jgi:hypothetical protein
MMIVACFAGFSFFCPVFGMCFEYANPGMRISAQGKIRT